VIVAREAPLITVVVLVVVMRFDVDDVVFSTVVVLWYDVTIPFDVSY
jgi:hypothetical protein